MIFPAPHTLKDITVGFEAHRVRGAQTVWLDTDALEQMDPGCAWTKRHFAKRFAYGVRDTACFESLRFAENKKKFALAERYGGFGMNSNGGGSRCGIIDGVQIKGIGQNPLVGKGEKVKDSYGGFILIEAVMETICSAAFSHILPVGTVPVLGLIYIGRHAAWEFPDDDNRHIDAPGAILVREPCLRPAHFIRSGFYDHDSRRAGVSSDVDRVRRVNRKLGDRYGPKDVVHLLSHFLDLCARQFAFAKLFRISHSVFSPSNVALDGRWVDTCHVSFQESGYDFALTNEIPSQHEEPGLVKAFAAEFADSFSKYNLVRLSMSPLFDFYDRRIELYSARFLPRLFGMLQFVVTEESLIANYRQLIKTIETIACGAGPLKIGNSNAHNPSEPATIVLESLFENALGGPISCRFVKVIGSRSSAELCAEEFKSLLKEYANNNYRNIEDVIVPCLIRSLRRVYFSAFYYKRRWREQTQKVISAAIPNQIDQLGRYIQQSIGVSAWLFADESDDYVYLYKDDTKSIAYSRIDDAFVLCRRGTTKCLRSDSVLGMLEDYPDEFAFCGFDFSYGIRRMTTFLRQRYP